MKLKKKIISTLLAAFLVLTVASSAFAATEYSDTVTVPAHGGNFFSNAHPATGSVQHAKVNSVTPSQTIYGTIVDGGTLNNLSSETTLYTTYASLSSGVQAGTSIRIMLETSLFSGYAGTVNFTWIP